jgi:hypothetical protein
LGSWAPASYVPVVGYEGGAKVELSVPLASLAGADGTLPPPNLTMVGAVLTGVGATGGPHVFETFPISRNLPPSMPVGGNFSDFVDASLETCLGPAQELHLY